MRISAATIPRSPTLRSRPQCHLHAWQKLPLSEHGNLARWMTERIESMPWWKETHVGEGFTVSEAA